MRTSHISTWRKAVATACAALILSTPARAGFMEDFYTSAGAAVNVTPAQVQNTQSMSLVTGGSMVWRVPNRNFQPFSYSPPSLKAGCGGIDVFLGAFGLVNRAQFVQFLRNVGQNAAGLAFKVALQAMAPELNSQIQDIANTIAEWNRHFGSSCQAAKALMDAGPNQFIKEKIQSARLNMQADGSSSDYSETDEAETNGEVAFANAGETLNSAGKRINAVEENIVWQILNSGDLNMSDREKELMMSLIGTDIYRKVHAGTSDESLEAVAKPKIIELSDLVGDPLSDIVLKSYDCGGDDDCLNPTVTPTPTTNDVSFARMVYLKAKGLRDAIMNREAPSADDLKLVTMTTSIPIYKIIQVSSMPSRAYYSDELLLDYSSAVGQEIASRYIEYVANQVEKVLRTLDAQNSSAAKRQSLAALDQRLDRLRRDMKEERGLLYAQISKHGAMIQQIQHIESALYSNISTQLAANSRFKG